VQSQLFGRRDYGSRPAEKKVDDILSQNQKKKKKSGMVVHTHCLSYLRDAEVEESQSEAGLDKVSA
jgi:hypothetical protein